MDKKCKKLGTRATKKERLEEHRAKMEMKRAFNEHLCEQLANEPRWTLANLSKEHEHYGDTPADHEKRKHNL